MLLLKNYLMFMINISDKELKANGNYIGKYKLYQFIQHKKNFINLNKRILSNE